VDFLDFSRDAAEDNREFLGLVNFWEQVSGLRSQVETWLAASLAAESELLGADA